MARTGRPKQPLDLTTEEEEFLRRLVRRYKTSQLLAQRARIVLLCAEGLLSTEVAHRLGITDTTVGKWRRRFLKERIHGLVDASRSGGPRSVNDEQVAELIRETLETKPAGGTHWSTRSMAEKQGLSQSTVTRIWRAFGLQPHRSETFQLSSDPFFVEKVRDVVGLYMDPPDNAMVLCVDEKSQIQALNRKQPLLPLFPGQAERGTPEYERNGTTSLFAALDIATGWVLGKCYRRHRSKEFLRFLKEIDKAVPPDLDLHIVLDNYATHKTPAVKKWLLRRPRYHLHFTPTHSSWLNMIESWFSILTNKQIKRGAFRSTRQLEEKIHEFVEAYNEKPKPFVWTKNADQLLESLARLCAKTKELGEE